MYAKPKGFNRVGIIQCFLAAFFVLWFLFLPAQGKYFAWPVVPEMTALFLGAGFILRSYFGYHLWRDKYWYTVRWSMFGDYAFLSVLFITTWWHIEEMNWHLEGVGSGLRLFSLVIVHVWVLAYTFEPLTVFLLHPRDPEAGAPVPAEYLGRGNFAALKVCPGGNVLRRNSPVGHPVHLACVRQYTLAVGIEPVRFTDHVRLVRRDCRLVRHHVFHEGLGRSEDGRACHPALPAWTPGRLARRDLPVYAQHYCDRRQAGPGIWSFAGRDADMALLRLLETGTGP